jgi:hypothetical protein
MGCGCLIALIGLGAPRIGLLLTWIFTDRLKIAFSNAIVPFLGFLVLPFTTLFWALAYAPVHGVSGFGYILVAFGIMLDLSSYGAGSVGQRRRGRA